MADDTPGDPPRRLSLDSPEGRLTLLASILGSAMPFLDGTAVNVALPAMAREMGTSFSGFQWILNAYLITLSAMVLPGGALSDRWGRRRAFMRGVVAFALASVLCGIAPDSGTLIGARALQGVAAAILIPASLSLVQTSFVQEHRGRALGLWSGITGLSTLVGPLLGGWLVDVWTWRAIFWLNVPLGLLALLVATRAVPSSRRDTRPMDSVGAVLAAATLGGIVFALTQGPEWGWRDPAVLVAGGLGLVALVGFVDAERSHARPMLPFRFFKHRGFVGANLVTVGMYFTLSGNFFLLTIQLQRVLGYSALGAGLALSPITAIMLVVSPLAGRWSGQWGQKPLLVAGPAVAAVGALLLARVGVDADYWTRILPGVVVYGTGLSLTIAPLTSAALSAVEDIHSGVAAGVNNAVARSAQLLAVPLLPLFAGISGMENVGGAAFSAGFQAAERINAVLLLATAVLAAVVLRPGQTTPHPGPHP
ncbi:MAG TPA: MFS transporter [Longimicrobiales bacterium]|nr:MFS transporter [Longimicrobiales bacterium]